MSEPSAKHMNGLNRVIHEPVRLAILKVLSTAKEADFNFLLATLGLTKVDRCCKSPDPPWSGPGWIGAARVPECEPKNSIGLCGMK